jgi:O-acetylserine/cysteine efflux transporter
MARGDIVRTIFVTAMWGLAVTGAKEVMAGTPTLLGAGARFLLSAMLLLALERRAGVPRASWRVAAPIGLLHTTGLFGFCYLGLEHSPASVASVIINLTPLLAVLIAVPVLGERPGRSALIGLLLALIGVAVISGADSSGAGLGLGFVALGALSWASATVALKRVPATNPLSLAARQMLVGAAVLLVAGALLDERRWAVTPEIAAWFAFLVLPAGAATFVIWFGVLERNSVGRVSPFMLLAPVFGVAGGVLLRGEPAHAALFLGSALIVAGVATAQHGALHDTPLVDGG